MFKRVILAKKGIRQVAGTGVGKSNLIASKGKPCTRARPFSFFCTSTFFCSRQEGKRQRSENAIHASSRPNGRGTWRSSAWPGWASAFWRPATYGWAPNGLQRAKIEKSVWFADRKDHFLWSQVPLVLMCVLNAM